MQRRKFMALLVGTAALPPSAIGAGAQSRMPVIGYLGAASARSVAPLLAIMRQGLAEGGYVEGQGLAIEYRWADGQYDRLPALAADLVRRRVDVIVATPTAAARAAKAATTTIPIVFSGTDDPVRLGLVASLARPGGNATGVYFFLSDLSAKHLGLLRELVPSARRIGLLINPDNANAEAVRSDVAAAVTTEVTLEVVQARDSREIETAFATLVHKKAEALVVAADPFFFSRRLQLATLATRHALPAVYNVREFAEAGGLMTYGTSLNEAHRQVGVYAARVLKGTRPADLPVVQSVKFELVLNLPTARALGLEVPASLIARADEVIE
jgi:putative ABC transport system substrate-binding protein